MLCLNVDLSIRLQYIAFRLIPFLLPSTSSMEFLRMMRVFAMNSSPYRARYIPLLKEKQELKTHKHAGTRTATKKTQNFWSLGRVSLTTGQPWCSLAGVVLMLLERCVLSYFWTSGFALDLPILGLLGLLFNLSSLGLPSTHILLLKLGPNHANLQS